MRILIATLLTLIIAGLMISCTSSNSGGFPPIVDAGVMDVVQDVHDDPLPEASLPVLDGGLPDGFFDSRSAPHDTIIYYGGPVLVSLINVYYIWYGNWTDTKTATILEDFMTHFGNSAWYQINTAYYQQPITQTNGVGMLDASSDSGTVGLSDHNVVLHNSQHIHTTLDSGLGVGTNDAGSIPSGRLYVSGTVSFLKSVYVGYTHGKALVDDDITTIVGETIAAGKLPPDPDGVYFVFTSSDVSETDAFGEQFCSSFCGWHGNHTIAGRNTRLAFVGDTGSCSGCSLQSRYELAGFDQSPNGDWSADSMASVIAHELAESATDPDALTNVAWEDMSGSENSDICSWIFGTTYRTASHSVANVPVGNRDFMLQEEWVLGTNGEHCGLTP